MSILSCTYCVSLTSGSKRVLVTLIMLLFGLWKVVEQRTEKEWPLQSLCVHKDMFWFHPQVPLFPFVQMLTLLSVCPEVFTYQSSDREDTPFSSHWLQGLSSALVFHCLALCSIDLTSSLPTLSVNNGHFICFGDGRCFYRWVVIHSAWVQLTGAKLRSGDYVTVTPQDVCHWAEHGCSSCLPAHSKFNVNQLMQVSHFRQTGFNVWWSEIWN